GPTVHMDLLGHRTVIDKGVAGCTAQVSVGLTNALDKEAEIKPFPSDITTETIGVTRDVAPEDVPVFLYRDGLIVGVGRSVDQIARTYDISALVREFRYVV